VSVLVLPVLLAANALLPAGDAQAARRDGLGFTAIAPSTLDDVVVPEGYAYEVLLRWGDPLFSNAPEFNPRKQSAKAQRR
jgi:secreted PhoX family phosphatase